MAEAMTGYRADEIIGQDYSRLYSRGESAHDKLLQDLEAAAAAWDGRYEEEEPRVRKDGTQFMANVVLTVLWNETGNLHGFTVVMRDVTARTQAEQEAAQFTDVVASPEPQPSRSKALIESWNQAAKTFSAGRRKR
jgi:PAS domain S-box-containing protein